MGKPSQGNTSYKRTNHNVGKTTFLLWKKTKVTKFVTFFWSWVSTPEVKKYLTLSLRTFTGRLVKVLNGLENFLFWMISSFLDNLGKKQRSFYGILGEKGDIILGTFFAQSYKLIAPKKLLTENVGKWFKVLLMMTVMACEN
jgi:hypothetical protein